MSSLYNKALRPAIFLDRDGTLNEDTGYVHKCEDWRWLEDVPKALAIFAQCGYLLVVVTNQSGICRGFYDAETMKKLHDFVNADLAQKTSCRIDAFYYCPHHPEITGVCRCRKPLPGLLHAATHELGINLANSWMIGDRMRDVQAGLSAGCRAVLLTSEAPLGERLQTQKVVYAQNLLQAAHVICDNHSR